MRFVAFAVVLLAALLLWAQNSAPAKSRLGENLVPRFSSSYELIAKSVMKQGGIREYAETVYTLVEIRNKVRRERWRITQQEKHYKHWISPSGMVWVLTSRVPGPGGSGRLWARDANADVRGEWSGWELGSSGDDKNGIRGIAANLDIDDMASKAIQLQGGSEQLRLVGKDGSEFRATIANTDTGDLVVTRHFGKGEPKIDLLTERLDKPSNPPKVEWPAPGKAQIAIWTFFSEQPNQFLIQNYNLGASFNARPNQTLLSERVLPRKPAYVDKTLTGKLLWFEFGQPWERAVAKLDILTFDGTLIKSIDLLKLGQFQSAEDAQKMIQYRDVLDEAGGGPQTLDSQQRYGEPKIETLTFADRTGRKYRIEIKASDADYEVEARASMNLDKVATKEPTYPGATLYSQIDARSDDGKFTVHVKNYRLDGKQQSQITLIANVTDPIEGSKQVELFSLPIAIAPASLRVSNSGRVFALTYPGRSVPGVGDKEMCLFQAWDASGHTMSMDLISNLKWFDSAEGSKGKLDLSKMKIGLEGLRSERVVEGVQVPLYPLESLTFDLGGGRTECLYIGYMNDQIPTMFYSRRPKGPGQ
ncbi:MAG: hypothetical protein IT203_07005 [Fimbriimonadaceae bacterium]|nr:hypothetical protein [Fimbriimonadaceae bacterium]